MEGEMLMDSTSFIGNFFCWFYAGSWGGPNAGSQSLLVPLRYLRLRNRALWTADKLTPLFTRGQQRPGITYQYLDKFVVRVIFQAGGVFCWSTRDPNVSRVDNGHVLSQCKFHSFFFFFHLVLCNLFRVFLTHRFCTWLVAVILSPTWANFVPIHPRFSKNY